MSVEFKVIQRSNPQDQSAAPLYYAMAVRGNAVDIDTLSELISDGSTVRQNDVYAVLVGMVNVILRELKEGRVIRLGKLGTFAVSVSSSGHPTDEEVNANSITKARILYRPEKELRNMLKLLQFKKQNPPSPAA
ncbi:MAG: DNA-binding protein [Bacteroidetes bacterium]|nr:DNA-binding protein [Bacteroidota bacterium]